MTDPAPVGHVATYDFDGRAWIVQFPDLGIATFGRTLASAKRYARSALAVHLELEDLDAAGVELSDKVRLPADIDDDVHRLSDKRAKAENLRAEVAAETRRTAIELRRLGLSTRDVGEILGVSGARVAQIEREVGGG